VLRPKIRALILSISVERRYKKPGLNPGLFVGMPQPRLCVIPQPTPFAVERSPLRTMDSTGGISRLLRHGLGDDSSSGASCRTHDENGLAVWTLRIGKEEIPGRWIIVDREFQPAQ